MFRRKPLWVVVAVLLTAPFSGADNCDNQCRMRKNFYNCPLDSCLFLDRAECARCTNVTGNNNVCDKSTRVAAGTCQQSGTNRVKLYTGCLYNCNCDSGRNVVEAQAVEVLGGTWLDCDWWQCLP